MDTESTVAEPTPSTTEPSAPDTSAQPADAVAFEEDSVVHAIDVTFEQAAYDEMIATYRDENDKSWIEADLTIDGREYRQVGMRLKGNSSLFSISGDGPRGPGGPGGAGEPFQFELVCENDPANDASEPPDVMLGPGGATDAEKPETLPWLIRLDKYVEGQNHDGRTEFVVRSSFMTTALNEAVALDLLGEAGLATQKAALSRLTINGGDEALRLVIEHPDDTWMESNLGTGQLYKADASGNYDYRGDNPDDYSSAWDQKGGDDNLAPLVSFLDFVNNSSDEDFVADLPNRLDVDAFARYLAIQDLFGNFDDIDGPGNNSYLYADANGKMTVVAWDHNLSFVGMSSGPGGLVGPGGPGVPPVPGDLDPANPGAGFPPLPEGCSFPEGFDPAEIFGPDGPGGPGVGGPNGPGGPGVGISATGENVLVNRFRAVPEFEAMITEATATLQADLFDSGTADAVLDRWTAVIADNAGDLVSSTELADEAELVRSAFARS